MISSPHRGLAALSLVALITLLAHETSRAQEWTRFRGPNGTGISHAKTIPTTFTEKDYNWKTRLPAGGHSSPVLWGDRIFLTCANDETGLQRYVVCLSAATGKILWSKEFSSKFHRKHKFNSFASATPAVDEERVYCVWSTPDEYTLLALDHDGHEVWRRNLGPYVSQHSSGISPIVYEELVVLGNDQDLEGGGKSFLIAVDRRTGATRWQVERNSDLVSYSTPCVYQPPKGKPQLIFNSRAHGMTAIDPDTGATVWEFSRTANGPVLSMRSVSAPVLANGLLTISCGSGGGGNYLLAVKPPASSAEQPEIVYKIDQKSGAPYVPSPLAKDDLLFLWSDKITVSCVDAASGKMHWTERLGGNYFGSPIWIDGKLYCVSTDGEVVVLAASKEFKELGRSDLGEVCHSTPAVADGKLFIRTYQHLICVGGKK